ncbi:MAG: hypothetical protein ACRC8A_13240 [Microcoleaceae cyanobacterium]
MSNKKIEEDQFGPYRKVKEYDERLNTIGHNILLEDCKSREGNAIRFNEETNRHECIERINDDDNDS